MLVLQLKKGERAIVLHPGGPTVITFVEPKGRDGVRIGFDAPRAIPIHRESVYQRILADGEHGEGGPAAEVVRV